MPYASANIPKELYNIAYLFGQLLYYKVISINNSSSDKVLLNASLSMK